MTKKEIAPLIKDHILPSHADYFHDGNILFKRFGEDLYIKGYAFSTGGRVPRAMHVTYFMMPLFSYGDGIAYNYGRELYYAYREGLFNLRRRRNLVWDVGPA